MTDDIDYPKLGRYLAGECGEQEATEIRRWIAADPANAASIARLERVWRRREAPPPEWDVDSAWLQMAGQLDQPGAALPSDHHAPSVAGARQRPFALQGARSWRRIAAAIAILAAGGATVWAVARRSASVARPAPLFAEVTSQRGQRAQLRLPDGTRVVLGPATILRYAIGASGPRAVELSGSALFTVVHDSTRPFAVRTARGMAIDLGTRFVVRAYPSDTSMYVAVADGKVSLAAAARAMPASRSPAGSVLLEKGDVGRVGAEGRLSAERDTELDRYLAWTDGRLVFHDTPLDEAMVELGRWYDLDIQVLEPELAARRLTAKFRDESPTEALRLIAVSLELSIAQHGKQVTIRSKP